MSQILPFTLFRAFTTSGTLAALAGGKLYSYEAGTSTPKPLYTDSTLATPISQPIILDQYGQYEAWADDDPYKLNLTDANDVQMPGWPLDNIQLGISGSGSKSVDTIADLRALSVPTGTDPTFVFVGGYYTKGAPGGGHFYWNSTSTASDDGGITFELDSAPGTGRFQRIPVGMISLVDFGAEGDYIEAGAVNATPRDNLNQFNNCFSYCRTNGLSVRGPKGSYLVTGALNCAVSIIGDQAGKIEDNVVYASATWNTGAPNNLDGFSIVWDNTVLTTSSVYMNNVSGDDTSDVRFKNVTFYSLSSGADGGGKLFVNDVSQATTEYDFGNENTFEDCRIVNFTTAITTNLTNSWTIQGVEFRGCQKTLLAGNSVPEIANDIKMIGCKFKSCGDTSTAFISLDNVIGFMFENCTFEKTSEIALRLAIRQGLAFDNCYFNDISLNSAGDFITVVSTAGFDVDNIVFNRCSVGASPGNINLIQGANVSTISIVDSNLLNVTIPLGTDNVTLTKIGNVLGATTSGTGDVYEFTNTAFQHTGIGFGVSSSERQIRTLTADTADTESLSISSAGDSTVARGGKIELFGDDHSGTPSEIVISGGSGGAVDGDISLTTAAGAQTKVTNTDDSTSGTTGALISSGGLGVAKDIVTSGDLVFDTIAKGLQIKEGANDPDTVTTARMGIADCQGDTARLVKNTTVTANTRFLLSFAENTGGLASDTKPLYIVNRNAGTSFSIKWDGSNVNTYDVLWILIEPS